MSRVYASLPNASVGCSFSTVSHFSTKLSTAEPSQHELTTSLTITHVLSASGTLKRSVYVSQQHCPQLCMSSSNTMLPDTLLQSGHGGCAVLNAVQLDLHYADRLHVATYCVCNLQLHCLHAYHADALCMYLLTSVVMYTHETSYAVHNHAHAVCMSLVQTLTVIACA